ncbi:T9SS type A sorting domain-containing protein [Winogradskyella litorisediminis]|uniref:T9SS type A sorting domain-containing protein n=1 Tax=Winogradskyella litorisediminis TaxID=1156618 RepID=A0ABW3N7M8_9FLAO
MKKITFLTLLLSIFCWQSYSQDTCATAVTLTPGVAQVGDTTGNSPGSFSDSNTAPEVNPCSTNYNDQEYWFAYTATETGETLDILVTDLTSNWYGVFVIDNCPDSSPTCIASDTNSTSMADLSVTTPSLTAGTTYYIVMSDFIEGSTTFTMNTTVIAAPTCLLPENLTSMNEDTTADFSWMAGASGETSWEYALLPSSDPEPTSGTTIMTTSFAATGLTVSTDYTFWLRANCGPGDNSEWVSTSFTTTDGPPPVNDECSGATPYTSSFSMFTQGNCAANNSLNLVTASNDADSDTPSCDASGNFGVWYTWTATSVGLNFTSGTGLPGIAVYEAGTCGSLVQVGCLNNVDGIILGMTVSNDYLIHIWDDTAGNTVEFCLEEFTPPPPPNCAEAPITPLDGETGVDASTNEVTFSWTAPSTGDAPSGYEIFLGTESGNLTSLGVTPNVSEPITGIEGGTTYYWQVVPENLGGSATGCPEWSFTTAPIAPPSTIGTITINSCGESDSFTNTYVIGEVTWVELVVVAEGCDFSFNTLTSTIGDSEIGIYSEGGVLLGSNDDAASGGLLSELLAADFPAGTYYIAASAYNVSFGPAFGVTTDDDADAGDIIITVTSVISNDDCADAEAVTFGNEVSASNTGATDSNVTGTCFTGNIRDVWYSAVADATGEIYVNSLTPGFQYAIYSDCSGTEVSCNAGATGLTDGSTYYIRITDDGTGTTRASGAFSFTPSTMSLSTNDFDSELGFKYYPNPVKNTLTLDAQQNIDTVVMYNMLGQEVLRLSPNSVSATVDMSNLNTGAYFATVSILGNTETVRVIKQ